MPSGVPLPSPASTWPSGPTGNSAPYMYMARRTIAGPAITFSDTASCRKPAGASTWHRPAATSAVDVTPSTPAKWSMWEWV